MVACRSLSPDYALAFGVAFDHDVMVMGEEESKQQGEQGRPDQPEWPAHFPQECPPTSADDLSGVVHMLVKNDPPTPEDMRCAMDRNSFRDKPACYRAALSCARDAGHLRDLRGISKRLRDHLVASGTFSPEHGKIEQTGTPGHSSMWLRARYLAIGHTLLKVEP